MKDPTLMEKIRRTLRGEGKSGGFPWVLLILVGLIVAGMAMRPM